MTTRAYLRQRQQQRIAAAGPSEDIIGTDITLDEDVLALIRETRDGNIQEETKKGTVIESGMLLHIGNKTFPSIFCQGLWRSPLRRSLIQTSSIGSKQET
jgi:hypothetical protein